MRSWRPHALREMPPGIHVTDARALDEWLSTDGHTFQCAARGEGQNCCLDTLVGNDPDDADLLVLPLSQEEKDRWRERLGAALRRALARLTPEVPGEYRRESHPPISLRPDGTGTYCAARDEGQPCCLESEDVAAFLESALVQELDG